MPRVEIGLTVRVYGALSGGALPAGPALAARPIARDGWGRLVLAGSHLKGRVRHACEQLARALGQPVCRPPRAATMCPHAPEVAAPPCVVCALFGSPSWRSPLCWSDLPCISEGVDGPLPAPAGGVRPERGAGMAGWPTVLRAGGALNRRRGTAEPERRFLLETTPPEYAGALCFAKDPAIVGQVPDATAVQFLLAGCRLVVSVGAGETRGLGWSEVVASARLDGAPVAFQPALLDRLRPRRGEEGAGQGGGT
ncbi:MAG TPA: RAMP superfamily CRISPR-associated protein [Chloroflexota bacterium]|nr:RAMP superfamily CRISPR-associated protein [Chloroflexota bacterium]